MEISIPQSPHFRNIIGILYALVVGVIVVGTIETIGHTVYPPPADLDINDAVQMKKYMESLPVVAMLFVIAAWAAGMFSGCVVAGVMGVKQGAFCCTVYGIVFAAMVVLMLYAIPSPIWFTVIGVAILPLTALAGYGLSRLILKRLGSVEQEETETSDARSLL